MQILRQSHVYPLPPYSNRYNSNRYNSTNITIAGIANTLSKKLLTDVKTQCATEYEPRRGCRLTLMC